MKKTPILILGGTGMLGSAVGAHFLAQPKKYDVLLTTRDSKLRYGPEKNWTLYDPTGMTLGAHVDLHDVLQQMPENPAYLINCVGVIKPFISKSPRNSILVNSLLPHDLARTCDLLSIKMIHITTDCVFSGAKGNYVEADLHDCTDSYGKTKSLGEPGNCMVLRTSIIGPEIHNGASLVAWAQSQAKKNVKGFLNHYWNGVTTKQYAKICDDIISKEIHEVGTHHVFSDQVNKFDLLRMIDDRFDLRMRIESVDSPEGIDRTLGTSKELCGRLTIPPLEEQIAEM